MSRWGIIDNSLEGRQAVYFPHWSRGRCPTDPAANARYRQKMRGVSDPREREHLRKMCREDLLFYLMTFVYIFQAKEDPKPVAFLPYDFQIECFTKMWKCLHDGKEDMRIIKPRYMGATWMIISLFEHAWHYMRDVHLLIGSQRHEDVDGTTKDASGISPVGEWSKLLPKIDYIHVHQPSWLWPRGYIPRTDPYRTQNKIVNPELGCLVTGQSASPIFGRSGRFYGIFFDEHAHAEYAHEILGACSITSDCHFWLSTPNGPSTAHAMLGRAPIQQIRLDWWMHPEHAKDMTVDPEKGDRGRWSPWLEKAMIKIGYDPVIANNEIWADESQTGGSYYPAELYDILTGVAGNTGTVRDCSHRGEIDFRVDVADGPIPTRWVEQMGGRWQLWTEFDVDGRIPRNERFIIGADVATGSTDSSGRGASNSTIAVVGRTSRCKVAEFAAHGLPVHRFLEVYVAAARFFCGPERHGYMIWDGNGPGAVMGDIMETDYGIRDNMYIETKGQRAGKAGFTCSKGNKESGLPWGRHVKMLFEGSYVERSRDCVDEMRHYQHNPTGGAPIHAASKNTTDPSGARENHGDRTQATVLACWELAKHVATKEKGDDIPPYGSLLHAKQLQRRAEWDRVLI